MLGRGLWMAGALRNGRIPPEDEWEVRVGDISGKKLSATSLLLCRCRCYGGCVVQIGTCIAANESTGSSTTYGIRTKNAKAMQPMPTPAASDVDHSRVKPAALPPPIFSTQNDVRTGCLSWSFVDGHLCRMLLSYGTYHTQNLDSVSAYIVTGMLAVCEGM